MMSYNPYSLKDKTILITGASSGIGKATAIECSKLGAKLIITARNIDRLQETLDQLQGTGHQIIVSDLSKEDEIDALVNQLPLLNGCVNNAGIIEHLLVQFINQNKLSNIFDINTYAPILLTQKLVKLKKIVKNSSIVFTGSLTGPYISYTGGSLYAATKGAIHGFIKGAALDLASKGIRVNSVNPGMVDTDIMHAGTITEEQMEVDRKKYPMNRYGKPEEVAWGIIYLLSDASAWTTGSSIVMDGGYTLL